MIPSSSGDCSYPNWREVSWEQPAFFKTSNREWRKHWLQMEEELKYLGSLPDTRKVAKAVVQHYKHPQGSNNFMSIEEVETT
jgi:hypothetical protein